MRFFITCILFSLTLTSLSQKTFDELLNNGAKHYQDGDLKGAITIFTEAIYKEPKNVNGYYFRGQMYLLSNEIDNAISDFKSAINLRDTLYQAFQYIGICYLSKKDTNQALTFFDKSLGIFPEYFDALQNKATIYIGQSKFTEAAPIIDKTLQMSSSNSLANFQKGYYLLKTNDTENALKYFEKSRSLGYNNDALYNGLAICYLDKQDYSKALLMSNNAISMNADISGYHINKAIILMNMGLKEMSKTTFKKAIELGGILNAEQKKMYDSL